MMREWTEVWGLGGLGFKALAASLRRIKRPGNARTGGEEEDRAQNQKEQQPERDQEPLLLLPTKAEQFSEPRGHGRAG